MSRRKAKNMGVWGDTRAPKNGTPRALRPLERVILDEDYLAVLHQFANGAPLLQTVRRHEIDRLAFMRFAKSTPARAEALAEAERIHAYSLMEGCLVTAQELLRRKDVSSVMAYYRIAREMARALDNRRWGEKVEVAAQALVIHTNLGEPPDGCIGGKGRTNGREFRMTADIPVVEVSECLSGGPSSGAETVSPEPHLLPKCDTPVDPGVD